MSLLQNQPVLWTVSKVGGVDLSDQINQYDSCLRKTTKWYKKLFFHLFNLCIVNSYLLYKKFSEKKLNSHDFKIALARSLIEEAPDASKPNTSRGRKHTGDKAARLTERHFPENIPAKPGAKRLKPCRDCYACNPKILPDRASRESRLLSGVLTVKKRSVFLTVSVCIIPCRITEPCYYLAQVVTPIVIENCV